MAIGDEATNAGFQVVPDTGEDGKVAYGAREINRTRDYIAKRTRSGTTIPANDVGTNGDIFFKVI